MHGLSARAQVTMRRAGVLIGLSALPPLAFAAALRSPSVALAGICIGLLAVLVYDRGLEP